MIDLTPLDVRNKRGDFRRNLRGYDPDEVDVFLELVAERLEAVVRDNLRLRERAEALAQQVNSHSGRERAVQEALVTAQELRADIRSQAEREAELVLQEARSEAKARMADAETEAKEKLRQAERRLAHAVESMEEAERRRARFLKTYRQLLERELDVVEVEEGRRPLEDHPIELELGGSEAPEEVPLGEGEDGSEEAAYEAVEAAQAEAEGGEPADYGAGDRDWQRSAAPLAAPGVAWQGPAATEAEEHADAPTEGEGEGEEEEEGASRLFTLPELPTSTPDEGEDSRWG